MCTDLTVRGLVVMEDEFRADFGLINPGDIIKVESNADRAERIVVVRRVWEEYASSETKSLETPARKALRFFRGEPFCFWRWGYRAR